MRSIFTTTACLAVSLLLPTTLAEALQVAVVTIESSHGGAGQGLSNITVDIPLTATYTNRSALAEVSTLYLVDARGVPFDSVTCTPFRYANGSGDAGLPFNETSPSFLSTNTVEVGSIVCISTHVSFAPPGGIPGGPKPLTTSSSSKSDAATKTSTSGHHGGAATSTLVTTPSAGGASATPSTSTMVLTTGGGSGPSQTSGSSTTSATAALSSGNSASGITLGSEFFGGLALAGFGIAFVL